MKTTPSTKAEARTMPKRNPRTGRFEKGTAKAAKPVVAKAKKG